MGIKGIPKDTFKEAELLGMDEFATKYYNKVVVMDVLGIMYNFIMDNMMSENYRLIQGYFRKICQNLHHVILVVDVTDHSIEKKATHEKRILSKVEKLKDFKDGLDKMHTRINNNQRFSKAMFKIIKGFKKTSFVLNEERKNKLVELLEEIQLNNIEVVKCEMEADVYISKTYKDEMIFSNDSDYLFHTDLQNIIKFSWNYGDIILRRFNRENTLQKLKINRLGLKTMGIIMSNDYDKNVKGIECVVLRLFENY